MNLSDRDLAFLIWFGAATVGMLVWPTGRAAVRSILDSLRGPLLTIALLYTGYFALVVAGAQSIGLWTNGLLKDTLAWYVLAGLALLYRFPSTYQDRNFYRRTLGRLISASVAVEFFLGLTSFSFGVELLLLPLIVVLGVLAAWADAKPEYRQVKSFLDNVLGLLGLVVIVGTAIKLINVWTADPAQLGLMILLPFWATFASLIFVSLLGLYANYQPKLREINRAAANDRRARWRAKLALMTAFWLRNYELGRFSPFDARELAETTSWGEARRLVAFQRAKIRSAQAEQELAAATLVRYAGVEGSDWRGQPLDQREFPETKEALERLARLEAFQYEQNGRYNADLPVGILVAERLPPEHGMVVKDNKKGTAWFAWRRTVTGWCLGIGAKGAPPDQWTYAGPEPPAGFPKRDTGWQRGEFDDERDD
jgi:hypothetical protein